MLNTNTTQFNKFTGKYYEVLNNISYLLNEHFIAFEIPETKSITAHGLIYLFKHRIFFVQKVRATSPAPQPHDLNLDG